MLKIVIDASVVIGWITVKDEQELERVRQVYELVVRKKIEAWAPVFLLVEIFNILVMKKKVGVKEAREVMKRLRESGIKFAELGVKDIEKLGKIVGDCKVTAYDAEYLWLAEKKKCKVLTLDRELLKLKDLTVGLEEFLLVS